jgi:hypothetical protein
VQRLPRQARRSSSSRRTDVVGLRLSACPRRRLVRAMGPAAPARRAIACWTRRRHLLRPQLGEPHACRRAAAACKVPAECPAPAPPCLASSPARRVSRSDGAQRRPLSLLLMSASHVDATSAEERRASAAASAGLAQHHAARALACAAGCCTSLQRRVLLAATGVSSALSEPPSVASSSPSHPTVRSEFGLRVAAAVVRLRSSDHAAAALSSTAPAAPLALDDDPCCRGRIRRHGASASAAFCRR